MFTPNQKTLRILDLLEEILLSAQQAGKKVAVVGGLALELAAAAQRGDELLTRNHDDLDIAPLQEDIPFWQDWFLKKGYILGTNEEIKDPSKAFIAHSPDSTFDGKDPLDCFSADFYSIGVNSDKTLYSSETGQKDNWEKTWDEEFTLVKWGGHLVHVMRPELAIALKKAFHKDGHTVRDKDLHDFTVFDSKNCT